MARKQIYSARGKVINFSEMADKAKKVHNATESITPRENPLITKAINVRGNKPASSSHISEAAKEAMIQKNPSALKNIKHKSQADYTKVSIDTDPSKATKKGLAGANEVLNDILGDLSKITKNTDGYTE